MGTPLRPRYIPYNYMDPLGLESPGSPWAPGRGSGLPCGDAKLGSVFCMMWFTKGSM